MRPIRSAADFIPPRAPLSRLREAAAFCQGCDLYKRATQTVFGEGNPKASIAFVGEQPGDYEDRAGRPFVGPAGRLFDKALAEVGLPREDVYITNAVKHFKWIAVGKRRKHNKPSIGEINACSPWLEAELLQIRPKIIVCLGNTAAQAILRRPVVIREERGTFQPTMGGALAFVTIHPSAILRAPEREEQERDYVQFVKDLSLVRARLSTVTRIA